MTIEAMDEPGVAYHLYHALVTAGHASWCPASDPSAGACRCGRTEALAAYESGPGGVPPSVSCLPLTLIPHGMWHVNVRSAMPERWDEIRHEVYKPHVCEACGGGNAGRPWQAHEYWSWSGGRQVLTRIANLCDVCHAATHLGRTHTVSGSDQATREALQHLADLNHWTVQQAAEYARRELAPTAERSKREWRLDLPLLAREFGIRVPKELGGPSDGLLRRLLGVTS